MAKCLPLKIRRKLHKRRSRIEGNTEILLCLEEEKGNAALPSPPREIQPPYSGDDAQTYLHAQNAQKPCFPISLFGEIQL